MSIAECNNRWTDHKFDRMMATWVFLILVLQALQTGLLIGILYKIW
jgi:hypothetical protein